MKSKIRYLNLKATEHLLSEDDKKDLELLKHYRERLLRKNVELLKSRDTTPILSGVAEEQLEAILAEIRKVDASTTDHDISREFSRGIVEINGEQFFWSLDSFDTEYYEARHRAKTNAISIMPVAKLRNTITRK